LKFRFQFSATEIFGFFFEFFLEVYIIEILEIYNRNIIYNYKILI